MPESFFTQETILTLTGASMITLVITNTVHYVFNFNPRWFGLGISLLLSFTGVVLVGEHTVFAYFVGLLNGFLIYASATGLMQMVGRKGGASTVSGESSLRDGKPADQGTAARRFLDAWY
ncbi:MAG: hypothetical protein R2751_01345 [Bacteroidales bacterium]